MSLTGQQINWRLDGYLHHVLQHIAEADTLEKIEALLPWKMKKASRNYGCKGAESLALTLILHNPKNPTAGQVGTHAHEAD